LASRNKNVKDSIVGYFSIYCSVNKTKNSLNYYPWRYDINPTDVGRFSFRDDGCMGYMKFSDKGGNEIKKIPYLSFWFGTRSFFVNHRCLLCIDQLGELADISFGDIHIEPFLEDKVGTNSLITRSVYWEKMLHECKQDGYITLEEIPIETLVKSQTYTIIFKKGAGVKTNFMLRKMIGKKNPVYDDYQNKERIMFKNIIAEMSKVLMRVIGRHQSMWFIIRLLDRT
jgi:coenzyme F420 hydrogenase subunit beta